ncbi:hypothetical protein RFI_06092 [Reticulomyxa filosa]|uniref:TLDc domain-containing protein n=1 Tax=Reticulomyxa filosa TaxID=46433 RepID=X6P0H3_RETFI|nr:hypothetical protein RFI_06092 [Reticulomyxa filosa]|eukprot:ETO31027.1 hypothetical protein RFI_06092 [Reticulomyxa filosa]
MTFTIFWKGKCVLEVEMKSVYEKKKKSNEIDEKKSNDIENTNASSSSSISIGSASVSVSAITAAVTGWAKVADILCHENKSNTAVIKHDSFRISDQYLFRMRGCFTNRISFTPYSIFDSAILSFQEEVILQSLLPKEANNKIRLLFRASRDGFSVYDFHNKCDNKGATVTVVQSNVHNHVFGGFTNLSWTSSNAGYTKENNSFIFLLRSSKSNQQPQKWGIKPGHEQHAIYDYSGYGPTFGLFSSLSFVIMSNK